MTLTWIYRPNWYDEELVSSCLRKYRLPFNENLVNIKTRPSQQMSSFNYNSVSNFIKGNILDEISVQHESLLIYLKFEMLPFHSAQLLNPKWCMQIGPLCERPLLIPNMMNIVYENVCRQMQNQNVTRRTWSADKKMRDGKQTRHIVHPNKWMCLKYWNGSEKAFVSFAGTILQMSIASTHGMA